MMRMMYDLVATNVKTPAILNVPEILRAVALYYRNGSSLRKRDERVERR